LQCLVSKKDYKKEKLRKTEKSSTISEMEDNEQEAAVREDLQLQLNEMSRPILDELVGLWTTMGLGYKNENSNVQSKRIEPMINFLKEKLEGFVKEDKNNLNGMIREIAHHEKERKELRHVLSITGDDSGEDKLSLIDVEKKIRDEIGQLKQEKEERMKFYEDAKRSEAEACELTGSNPCYIAINLMPTDEQVRQVEQHVRELHELRQNRERCFDFTVAKIHELYQVLETEPGNSERNLVCSEGKSIACLSQNILDKVEKILQDLEVEKQSNEQTIGEMLEQIKEISATLHIPFEAEGEENSCSSRVVKNLRNELNSLEEERRKHLAVFIQDAKTKLQVIWKKCYVSEAEKEQFENEIEAKMDEDDQLNFYKENIKKWTSFYEDPDRNRTLFKIEDWFSLLNDRLKLELSMKDPSRLGNFKALGEEEKMRKKVNTKLPKTVEEIKTMIGQLCSQGKEFKIYGMTFEELNDYQETEHNRKVQEERDLKKHEKMKTVSQESIYGVKKASGNKTIRSENKTLKPQVKRLQHSSLKATKGFATPTPKSTGKKTPGSRGGARKALRDRNETYVRGMAQASIATVDGNIFDSADVASSTLKAEQIRKNLPTPSTSSVKKYNGLSSSAKKGPQTRNPRGATKIPFLIH